MEFSRRASGSVILAEFCSAGIQAGVSSARVWLLRSSTARVQATASRATNPARRLSPRLQFALGQEIQQVSRHPPAIALHQVLLTDFDNTIQISARNRDGTQGGRAQSSTLRQSDHPGRTVECDPGLLRLLRRGPERRAGDRHPEQAGLRGRVHGADRDRVPGTLFKTLLIGAVWRGRGVWLTVTAVALRGCSSLPVHRGRAGPQPRVLQGGGVRFPRSFKDTFAEGS